ncbi:MAG TPA: transposase [Alcanivorax sp.]|nr:transposase [Alcanivorax sp.]
MVPNYPHHILQRGHNGQEIFEVEEDYRKYLTDLRALKARLHVKVYGWCLLPDQVHMLIDPGSNPDMLSELMKALAARTTRHRNRRGRRTGTLWESRYRSSVVQRGTWTLASLRYLEKKPVLLGLAPAPARYPWSSFGIRMGREEGAWLDQPEEFLNLGGTEEERRHSYRIFMEQHIHDQEADAILGAAMRNQLTGDKIFTDEVEKLTGVRVSMRGRGRPPGKPTKPE